MYNDGLIYRGYRVVNWDPKGQTTISDDEIVYEERKAVMYTFKYSKDFPIYISTTRPETKVGDTAVAVHPNDKRYKKFVGQIFEIENFVGEKLSIKIIADESVDPELGTGALGVTPAHSQVDWEIAQRHNLPLKPVINEHARMSVESTLIKDKKTTEAREIIVNWLRVNGLLEKEEEVMQNVSTAERTGGIIEPLPKLQWFIDVNKEIPSHNNKSLKELMLETVKNGEIKIVPDRFKKVYYNWIENLRDWCISRQIWFGHRIPVWYHGEEIYCDIKAPKEKKWVQDEDTLDTWFSSGLWTFSTLGWPEITDDFKNYYPTTMLETGYDILFFWIARMILMSTYATGQIPFKNVYLHGLVRDNQGRKISKSLGNNIDPINIINEYGADALRMALIVGTGPGNDTKLDLNKVKAYKHFANKIWNVTRFVLSNAEDIKYDENFSDYTSSEKKLIKERDELINKITKEMEEYKFYLVSEKIYHYVWHTLADVILEESKKIFSEGNDEEKKSRKQFLLHTLRKILICLHPFMPFVTEEIWSVLPLKNKRLLMVEKW
jgi:valyl-tRNA synthetase